MPRLICLLQLQLREQQMGLTLLKFLSRGVQLKCSTMMSTCKNQILNRSVYRNYRWASSTELSNISSSSSSSSNNSNSNRPKFLSQGVQLKCNTMMSPFKNQPLNRSVYRNCHRASSTELSSSNSSNSSSIRHNLLLNNNSNNRIKFNTTTPSVSPVLQRVHLSNLWDHNSRSSPSLSEPHR